MNKELLPVLPQSLSLVVQRLDNVSETSSEAVSTLSSLRLRRNRVSPTSQVKPSTYVCFEFR